MALWFDEKKNSPIFWRNLLLFGFLSFLATGNTAAAGTGNAIPPANSEWHGSRIRVPKNSKRKSQDCDKKKKQEKQVQGWKKKLEAATQTKWCAA